MNFIKEKEGFTLVELLIYMAILGGMSLFVAQAFILVNKGGAQAGARYAVNSSIRQALNSIEQDIKNANNVSSPITMVESSTLTLQIGPDTVTYNVSAGRLRRNGQNITPENVNVTSLIFRLFENINISLLKVTININTAITASYSGGSADYTYSESSAKTTLMEPFFDTPPRGLFGSYHDPGCQECNDYLPCVSILPHGNRWFRLFNKALAGLNPCEENRIII